MTPARRPVQAGHRLGMTVTQWPAPDQAAWRAAFRPASPLDPRPSGAAFRPTTRTAIEIAYARWLVWLTALHPDTLALARAARATEERVLDYVHTLVDEITLRTLVGYACRLQSALKLIAPETKWDWMTPIIRRIERRARQSPSRKHPFVPSDQLYAFGIKLMHDAETADELLDVTRAEAFRDGLAIALLAAIPLRRNNFIGLRIGQHIIATPGGYRIAISSDDEKTCKPLEFTLPPDLVGYLERYLADHRSVLLRASGRPGETSNEDALWLARSGALWPSDTFADMISRRTMSRFGVRLTPHDFRHCAATSIAQNNPAQAHIIRHVLGHTTGATSEKHYIHASRTHAVGRYQDTVMARRKPLRRSGLTSLKTTADLTVRIRDHLNSP